MLQKILKKLNLRWEDLNSEEKKTYREWERILNKKEITISELKKFIEGELIKLELSLLSPDNSEKKDLFLKAQIRVLRVLLGFINSPEKSKEWLEKYLEKLFKEGR